MLQPNDMRVVIMSRKRTVSCQKAHANVPFATVCIAEEEYDDYAWAGDLRVTHPNEVTGIGPIRCWMLEHFTERCVVSYDDDIKNVWTLVGKRARKITEPEAVWRVLYQAAVVTDDLGISCFSFATTPNLLDFVPQDPFGLTKALGPCLGFVGRRIVPDRTMDHCTDTDLSLQCCLQDRFVFQDCRYAFEHSFQSNAGGGTHRLTATDFNKYLKILERKWGKPGPDGLWDCIPSGEKMRTIVHIRRRQSLDI